MVFSILKLLHKIQIYIQKRNSSNLLDTKFSLLSSLFNSNKYKTNDGWATGQWKVRQLNTKHSTWFYMYYIFMFLMEDRVQLSYIFVQKIKAKFNDKAATFWTCSFFIICSSWFLPCFLFDSIYSSTIIYKFLKSISNDDDVDDENRTNELTFFFFSEQKKWICFKANLCRNKWKLFCDFLVLYYYLYFAIENIFFCLNNSRTYFTIQRQNGQFSKQKKLLYASSIRVTCMLLDHHHYTKSTVYKIYFIFDHIANHFYNTEYITKYITHSKNRGN